MRQQITLGGTDALRLNLSDHGRDAVPTSGSARILHNGEEFQSGALTNGEITPSAGVVSVPRQDVIVEWTYSFGGESFKRAELFDVVLFKLYPIASEADLIREAPSLISAERIQKGAVYQSTDDGFTDRSLLGLRDDWTGSILTILTGLQAGAQFIVSRFIPSTGEIRYPIPSGDFLEAGDSYALRKSYQAELDAAWDDVMDRLDQECAAAPGPIGGKSARPYLILTPDRLRRPHILKALEKAFRGIASDPTGIDWQRADLCSKDFEAAWSGISLAFAMEGSTEIVDGGNRVLQWGLRR